MSPGKPATTDMHILSLPDIEASSTSYQCIPAVPFQNGDSTPPSLVNHDVCAIGDSIFIFNGLTPDDEKNFRIWEFRTTDLKWRETSLERNAQLAQRIASGDRSQIAPSDRVMSTSTQNATYVLDQTTDHVDTLYLLSHEAGVAGRIIRFPGASDAGEKHNLPAARKGAKVVTITTGYGRNYLLLLPGICLSNEADFDPTIWALQLPSSPSSSAAMKDSTRDTLAEAEVPGNQLIGGESGEFSWAEVVIEARNEELGTEGKSLPAPLAWYGADVFNGKEVVIWGGLDPKGVCEGEGWLLKIK